MAVEEKKVEAAEEGMARAKEEGKLPEEAAALGAAAIEAETKVAGAEEKGEELLEQVSECTCTQTLGILCLSFRHLLDLYSDT